MQNEIFEINPSLVKDATALVENCYQQAEVSPGVCILVIVWCHAGWLRSVAVVEVLRRLFMNMGWPVDDVNHMCRFWW